jgi:cyclopropane fatty-acyl-phospholipid synthase-like methyltransferase
MDNYKETFATWNKVAKKYEEKFMDLSIYNASYDFLCGEMVQKIGSKILELGCGPGNITKYLLTQRPDFNILGIDIASNMVRLAKKNNPAARFKVMDIREMDQIESTFDLIVCGFCIPYLSPSNAEHFVKNINAKLEKEGLVYISFVEGNSTQSTFQISSSGDRVYFYFYRKTDLVLLLKKNNFIVIESFEVKYPKGQNEVEIHQILIAKRT